MIMDKRADKILFDAFWSSKGWKNESDRSIPVEDFEYAKSKGVMFDPIDLDHDEALNRLQDIISRLNTKVVANAFLASLSTRRLDWRSALGSYAVFRHLPEHSFTENEIQCSICGQYETERSFDLNVLNFERMKWGGVRHSDVIYAVLDLTLFLNDTPPDPTANDLHIFESLISAIKCAPEGTSSATLHKVFPKALKANKAEREVVTGILGYCGILGTPLHPGFSTSFVPNIDRILPDRHYVDMAYPACWWSSNVGINNARLIDYFGHVL